MSAFFQPIKTQLGADSVGSYPINKDYFEILFDFINKILFTFIVKRTPI